MIGKFSGYIEVRFSANDIVRTFATAHPLPLSQPLQPRQVISMADPANILAILHLVGTAALALCKVIDKAVELEHEEGHALKELRKGADSLRSDTLVYKVLLSAMENDTHLSDYSSYTRFIQSYVTAFCSQAHMLTERIMYAVTDRTDVKRWKALKERSRLPFCCSMTIQREIAMEPR